jgi:predicted nucleic acid-binding protein
VTFLLDSNPIIYYLNQQLPPAGKVFIDQLMLNGVAYSLITRLEVLGARMAANHRSQAEAMLSVMIELPMDDPIVDLAIQLRSTVRIKSIDALIAATARCHELTLVTRNTKDFEAIAGLSLIDPFQPPAQS